MRIHKYFRLEEFVPQEIFKKYGDNSIRFISNEVIELAVFLRERFGQIIINNWLWEDINFNYSGFRASDCKIGAKESDHKRGVAIDIKSDRLADIKHCVTTEIFQYALLENGCNYIENIEKTPSWIHFSCALSNSNKIIFY